VIPVITVRSSQDPSIRDRQRGGTTGLFAPMTGDQEGMGIDANAGEKREDIT
jgi:hypothetical protein